MGREVKPISMVDMYELQQCLNAMDVPAQRLTDLKWLSRNLGINNSKHPLYEKAMELIKSNLRET